MGTATKNLSPVSKLGLGVVGVVQVAFAILVNWIGPAAYFLVGIRR